MTAKPKAHASDAKKKEVKEIVKLLKEYPIVGLINIEVLPSAQMQKMKKQLREMMVVRMSKANFIKIAFEQVKEEHKNIEELEKKMTGMPAVIFTRENPFKICTAMNKSKSNVPIKPGQKAPLT